MDLPSALLQQARICDFLGQHVIEDQSLFQFTDESLQKPRIGESLQIGIELDITATHDVT